MKTIVHGNKENIQIRQVLMNSGSPAFVEYYSASDSRNHIINANRFCEIFGVSMAELELFNNKKNPQHADQHKKEK